MGLDIYKCLRKRQCIERACETRDDQPFKKPFDVSAAWSRLRTSRESHCHHRHGKAKLKSLE